MLEKTEIRKTEKRVRETYKYTYLGFIVKWGL